MTPSELKYHVEQAGHDRHLFTRKTMQFFGDTMRNYGVCESVIDTYSEKAVPVWELYRKRPVKGGLISSTYFRKDTFARVFEERKQVSA